jgi:hypothetical protein
MPNRDGFKARWNFRIGPFLITGPASLIAVSLLVLVIIVTCCCVPFGIGSTQI